MTILTIQPSNIDSFLDAESPNNNYGGNAEIWVVNTAPTRRSLLKFDFTALPAGVAINSATLSLYRYNYTGATGRTYWAYRLTQTGWTEGGVTWNKYDGTNNWTSAGGDYTATDGASQTVPAINNWMDFDVKALVEWFRDNAGSIAHFMVKDASESGTGTASLFYSKNEPTQTTLRPKLVIDYDLGTLNTASLNQRYILNAPTLKKEVLSQIYALNAPAVFRKVLNQQYALDVYKLNQAALQQKYSLNGVLLNTVSLNQRYALSGVIPNLASLNCRWGLEIPTGPYPLSLNQRFQLNGYHIPATILRAVTYTLTLTGAPDGVEDIVLPMSSFQSRLKDGDPSWLSAVVPNGRKYAGDVDARPNGEIVVTRNGYKEDGSMESVEIARVGLEENRIDEGGRSSSMSLSGHKTTSSGAPKGVALDNVSYRAEYKGKRHVDTKMDSNVVPGDQAEMDGQIFTIGEITRYVNAGTTKMTVTEA